MNIICLEHRMGLRLSENAHLLRYPHPSSLRRTSMYASFLGISEALQLDIFHQPLRRRFFDSLFGIRRADDNIERAGGPREKG